MAGSRPRLLSAYRAAIVGMVLAAAGGGVTLFGQLATYGRLLNGTIGFEGATLLLLMVAVLGLRSSRRRWRTAALLISALAAVWMLAVAASITIELATGAGEAWLPLDGTLTALAGLAWLTAAVTGVIDRRHGRSTTQPRRARGADS